MSYAEDNGHDQFSDEDYYGDEDDDSYDNNGRRLIKCDHCGKEGLIWSEIRINVFRLYDQKLGKLHRCSAESEFK